MPTYKDIFDLNLKYINYLLAKTSLIQGYTRNINVTGSEIEQEVRQLLRNLLPQRFHVTHGYIISATNQREEPLVSPQVDVIIVDTLVPHSIFILDQHSGMEVVPIEAVVGVFEVKRTLNRTSLLGTKKVGGAFKHLQDTCKAVDIRKDNKTMYLPGGVEIFAPGGVEGQGYYSNPIIGIIGVDHVKNLGKNLETWTEKKQVDFGLIDILFSINGYLLCTGKTIDDNQEVGWTYTLREKGKEYPVFVTYIHPPHPQVEIVAKALGFIIGYVSASGGRVFDITDLSISI